MSEETNAALPVRKEWILELDEPVSMNGKDYSQLELRQPTIGELTKAVSDLGNSPSRAKEIQMQVALVALVTGVPRGAVEKLPFSVVISASDWLVGFTGPTPPTSEA